MPAWWKVAGAAASAARGANKAGQEMGQAAGDAFAARRLERIPRAVARRGYLIPGDPTPPPGTDIADYRGLLPSGDAARVSATGPGAVALGAITNLDRALPGNPFRLPIQHFFRHLAILAPPGMGKTYGLIAPLVVRLLRAGASVVLLDVTGDLPEQVRSFAQQTPSTSAARVASFHWSIHPRRGTHRWNPLDGLDPEDIVAIEGVKAAVMGDEPADPKHRDFHDRDVRLFGALLTLTLHSAPNPTLGDVAEMASGFDRIETALRHGNEHLRYLVTDLIDGDTSGLWGLRNKLEPFLDPGVMGVIGRSDFSLRSITEEPSFLVVGAELELRHRSKAASALLVNRLMAELQGHYGDGHRQPVIFVMDEAPEIAKRIDLEGILATARGARTGVVLAAQNATQFGDEREASSVLDNCDGMILLPGGSKASIDQFRSRLGQRSIERWSVGANVAGRDRSHRVERSTEQVDTLGERELLDPLFSQHAAFYHSRSVGAAPVALDLTRGAIRE